MLGNFFKPKKAKYKFNNKQDPIHFLFAIEMYLIKQSLKEQRDKDPYNEEAKSTEQLVLCLVKHISRDHDMSPLKILGSVSKAIDEYNKNYFDEDDDDYI